MFVDLVFATGDASSSSFSSIDDLIGDTSSSESSESKTLRRCVKPGVAAVWLLFALGFFHLVEGGADCGEGFNAGLETCSPLTSKPAGSVVISTLVLT